jgi:Asp-tRNA(Asn)/Glu-tRNA(Gln) amidotransferase A subunit family amidase
VDTVQPADLGSEFTQLYLATGTTVAGKTQMSKYGFSVLAEHPRLGLVRNP